MDKAALAPRLPTAGDRGPDPAKARPGELSSATLARRESASREMVKAAITQASQQSGLSRREVAILFGEIVADRD
jgi:hypothetical protein